jgi:hypothetical protein
LEILPSVITPVVLPGNIERVDVFLFFGNIVLITTISFLKRL